MICFSQILRIINKNFDEILSPAQWYPYIVKQKGFFQFADKLNRYRQFGIKTFKRAIVEQRKGFADILLF